MADDPVQPRWRSGVNDDRVDSLRDQVRDLLRLLADVIPRVVDRAPDLLLVRRHLASGVEQVLHFDPPFVADGRIGQRDLPLLLRWSACTVGLCANAAVTVVAAT